MKRFSFRLETLLGHRKILEDLRDQEFALAQGRHEQARLQLEALQEHYSRTLAERPVVDGEMQFDAPAIQSRERYLEAVRVRIDEQEGRVEVARLILEEMRVARVAAKQAREAVSRLRDKDFTDYQAESQSKTQESLDEIGSVRFARQQIAEVLQKTETAARQRLKADADAAAHDSHRAKDQEGRKAA